MIPVHLAEGDSGLYDLREDADALFRWYLGGNATQVSAQNVEEAIKKAYKAFKLDRFMPIHCGTKFPLHDRDEHGRPALFKDLVTYLSSGGAFLDDHVGHSFVVKEIPIKSRDRALKYCQMI